MAVIFSYPIKSTPDNDDLILISDGTDRLTKQVRVSTLPGGSSAGVSSFNTLTGAVTITGGTNVTLNTVGNNIEINASGGGGTISVQDSGGAAVTGIDTLNFNTDIAVVTTPGSSTATVNFNGSVVTGTGAVNTLTKWSTGGTGIENSSIIDTGSFVSIGNPTVLKGDGTTNGASSSLKFNCSNNSHYVEVKGPLHAGGSQYGVRLPQAAPSNQQILQSDAQGNLSWINTPSSGGGGSVDSVQATDGTFIDLTPNSATTGAVTITADLSATGTAGNTTFLRGDNQWAVPAGTTYSAGTGLALNTNTFSLAAGAALTNLGGGSGSTFLKKDGTWATPTDLNTNIGGNNLILTSNRTLNFYSDTSDKDLTFIGGDLSGTKKLFKFDTVINKPRFTIGDTQSTYEGTLDIMGNGTNRTGKINLYNAAGTYSYNIQVPTTFGANSDIPFVLPGTQGAANTFLQNNGSGTLTWATGSGDTYTLQAEAKSGTSVPLKLDAATGTDSTVNLTEGSNITLTRNSANQITIASSGGGGSLGFSPLEIYSATTSTTANYIYYMVAVCDVDFTVNKCKVAVTSGTDPVYVGVYSMNYGNLQTSALTKLGDLYNSGSILGVNELSLLDSAFPLTAGQTICIGVSTACQLASSGGLNGVPSLSVMATSGGGSGLPSEPEFEGLGSANTRPAIHFYAS